MNARRAASLYPSFRLLLLAALTALCGCDQPMGRLGRIKPFAPMPVFSDGTSARTVPEHAVARGDSTAAVAESTRQIPLPVTKELLQRGRERFNMYCALCHGRDGYGDGIVVRHGFTPPPSYHSNRLRSQPVGHFYSVISNGIGAMYSYADRVSPADRWAIVAYIRALQFSQHATIEAVPETQRRELEKDAQ